MVAQDSVRFLPLGGLGEIGMNCFALEQRDEILVVDCGACFPDDDLGVDLVVPDFSWLIENQDRIVGVFITHGHEDHIGAVPHLLRTLSREVPLYAPPHACALIAARLQEQESSANCLHTAEVRQKYQLGSFHVEPVHVAHSIIDATSLAIETDAGLIVHTADFDLDREQPAGEVTDRARFEELGVEGVRLLLSDSTNIDSDQRASSEGDVRQALRRVVTAAEQRVVVGMFSSNAHRLLALSEAAQESGRKLCFLGRSLDKHSRIAAQLGAVHFPSDLLVSPEALADLPREECLVVAGGSQGEAPSALRRLSQGMHPDLQLEAGDTVILSSRVIPGNEKPVFTMMNDLARLGVHLVTRQTEPAIHTSGHASRDELGEMISWTSPRAFVPVHGTLHHMNKHRALAESLGVQETAVIENGLSLVIPRDEAIYAGEPFPAGKVRIAWGGEVMEPRVRRRRGEMARRGVVFVSVLITERGEPLGAPELTILGVPGVDDDDGACAVLTSAVRRSVTEQRSRRMSSLEEGIRRAIRSAVFEMTGTRPLVEVHVCHVGV